MTLCQEGGRLRLLTVTARRSVRLPRAGGLVSFTFDGFPLTAATEGAQLLEANGVRGTFYTSPGIWGKQWHGEAMATAQHVDDLHHDGHEIGCQPFSGMPVDRMSRRDLEQEVLDSTAAFRRNDADRRFSSFAFTEGRPTAAAKRQMGRRFAACRGMFDGLNAGRADLALLRSIQLADHTLNSRTLDQLLEKAHRRSGWLIFRIRDVREDPSPHGCSPSFLGHAIRRAIDLEMTVLPVRFAVGRITDNN
jgi:peptidoglycan/xylan/chitin deacetylase (PgdA/CDA1 family)